MVETWMAKKHSNSGALSKKITNNETHTDACTHKQTTPNYTKLQSKQLTCPTSSKNLLISLGNGLAHMKNVS